MEDSQPYLRGAVAAMGFSQIGVAYDRKGRERGVSKFSLSHLFALALDGILNHSVAPLRLATFTGIAVSVLTMGAIVVYVVGSLVLRYDWPRGFATTTVLILFSLSLNAFFLGIIGEYLGRIYKQVKKKPLTIIQESIDGAESVNRAPRAS
jgi:dolichol-phosphate mannosyltransferase